MSRVGPADPFAALVREFELELLHVKQMIALAAEEHRDLVAGDTARLDAISSEKLAQLRALELYATQRAAYLAAQGFTGDASGLAACAASAGRRGRRLTVAWRRLTEVLAELRDLNEENGALLRGRLAGVADAVSPCGEPREAGTRLTQVFPGAELSGPP
jgi:flagellar biosynthesis/type III secretory pathway chaperone